MEKWRLNIFSLIPKAKKKKRKKKKKKKEKFIKLRSLAKFSSQTECYLIRSCPLSKHF